MKIVSSKKNILLYLFWFFLIVEYIVMTITYFLYSFSVDFQRLNSLYKIPNILEFLTAFFYAVFVKKRIKFNFLSIVYCIFLPLGILTGVVKGQINEKFFAHIFSFLMPIFIMSLSVDFYEEYNANDNFRIFVKKWLNRGLISFSILTFLHLIFYSLGMLRYNNYGSGMGLLGLPFYLGSNNNTLLWGYMLAIVNVLTKKRVTLVTTVIMLFVTYIVGKRRVRNIRIHFVLGVGFIIACIFLALNTNIFGRIISTFQGILGSGSMKAATGGRDVEIEAILEYINADTTMWFAGIGFGGRVWIVDLYRHYSHFMPLSYVMTGGIFLSLSVYAYLFWVMLLLIVKGIRNELKEIEIPYVIGFFGALAGSFTGPNLFAQPMPWLFIGLAIVVARRKMYSINLVDDGTRDKKSRNGYFKRISSYN